MTLNSIQLCPKLKMQENYLQNWMNWFPIWMTKLSLLSIEDFLSSPFTQMTIWWYPCSVSSRAVQQSVFDMLYWGVLLVEEVGLGKVIRGQWHNYSFLLFIFKADISVLDPRVFPETPFICTAVCFILLHLHMKWGGILCLDENFRFCCDKWMLLQHNELVASSPFFQHVVHDGID